MYESWRTAINCPEGVEESEFRIRVEEEKDKIVAELCENVCRWSRMYRHTEYGQLKKEHCDLCPLSKI